MAPRRGRPARGLSGLRAAEDAASGVDETTVKFAAGLKDHLSELWGPPGGEDWSLYADDLEFKDPLVPTRPSPRQAGY